MKKLKVNMTNCYGISCFEHEFDFSECGAVAIYASNGTMKTSFAKSFLQLSNGEHPKEELFGRKSVINVVADGDSLHKDRIYVLKSDVEYQLDAQGVTDILVKREHKRRYDDILLGLEKQRKAVVNYLNKRSGVVKNDVEKILLKDWSAKDLADVIQKAQSHVFPTLPKNIKYMTLFDQKVLGLLGDKTFAEKAQEFIVRYDQLFECSGDFYKKGVFNPTKAEVVIGTLGKERFFDCGHRVFLSGDKNSIGYSELRQRIDSLSAVIDGDVALKGIQLSLAKNAATKTFQDFFESISVTEAEVVLRGLSNSGREEFMRDIWAFYLDECPEAKIFLDAYNRSRDEVESIEAEASVVSSQWVDAVSLFNSRFVDLPFRLKVDNVKDVTLGRDCARLKFVFEDKSDRAELLRTEIKTLSQGEKRALHLLNFVFDVEARRINQRETLFLVDDAADSFDYINKMAIVQYLDDLSRVPYFRQIILTHNFDFFRSLAFVKRVNMFSVLKTPSGLMLCEAEGVNNYLVNFILKNVGKKMSCLFASIPFARNIIEYTRGQEDERYKQLTAFLHPKSIKSHLTVRDYVLIFNETFPAYKCEFGSDQLVMDVLFEGANEICKDDSRLSLNLAQKIHLSIAIRMKAELWMIKKVLQDEDDDFNFPDSKQYSKLLQRTPAEPWERRVLDKVSTVVSNNIHLNSFMYEPIIDLTIEHLVALYGDVSSL